MEKKVDKVGTQMVRFEPQPPTESISSWGLGQSRFRGTRKHHTTGIQSDFETGSNKTNFPCYFFSSQICRLKNRCRSSRTESLALSLSTVGKVPGGAEHILVLLGKATGSKLVGEGRGWRK